MLKEKLTQDLKDALRSGDAEKRLVLGMVSSVIKNRELEKRSRLSKQGVAEEELPAKSERTDEEILEAIASEAKKRKESIASFQSAGRAELAEKEQRELNILTPYLPEQMSEEQVRAVVQEVVAHVQPQGPKDMGKVIGQVMARVKGKADGQVVSKMVQEALAGR